MALSTPSLEGDNFVVLTLELLNPLEIHIKDGEDEPDEVLVHVLVVLLGGEVHMAGLHCDVRVRVVPALTSYSFEVTSISY